MTVLLRAAALTNFEAVAGACGQDARALVAEVGLPSRCLTEPDLMVPAGLVNELLERAATRAGEPAFGLRMAATRRLSNLGPLGLLLRDQPTLRLALEALARHIHVHNESFSVTVVETGPLVGIREEILMERGRPVRHTHQEHSTGGVLPEFRAGHAHSRQDCRAPPHSSRWPAMAGHLAGKVGTIPARGTVAMEGVAGRVSS